MNNRNSLTLAPLLALLLPCASSAQEAGTPIVDQTPVAVRKANGQLIEGFRALIDAGRPLTRSQVDQGVTQPGPVSLTAPRSGPLPVERVAAIARAANLRVGYCYQCTKCEDWHLALAGGYAISSDVVVTCDHVIASSRKMREGYLVVADPAGKTYPVTAVIARSRSMDTALLRVEGAQFEPLPLNEDAGQGTAAYCHSSPLGQLGYFSAGIVNRFVWDKGYRGGGTDTLEGVRHLRANFSTDWAPGSSGSAVLDQQGNVLGHVSKIAGIGSKSSGGRQMMTLHTGIPARAVRMLALSASDPEQMQRLAEIESQEASGKKQPVADPSDDAEAK